MRSHNSIGHCITFAAAIFLTSTSLALAGAVINEKGYTQKQWEDCGAKAIREDLEQGVREGIITSIDESVGYYGAAGRGQWSVIQNACGGQPTDGKLDKAMQKALHEGCAALTSADCETAGKDDCILNAFDHLTTVHAIAFDSYADTSRLIHNARAMCAKIYTSHARERNKARAEAGKRKPWRIARLYSSTESGVRIVIETDRTRKKMKCAVYDSAGEPLAVDTGVITPPIDDLLIIVPARSRSVDNAKCWSE